MATLAPPRPTRPRPAPAPARPATPAPAFHFQSLVLTEPASIAARRGGTFSFSLAVHAALIAAIVIVPLFVEHPLPAPGEGLRAFFVEPAVVAPPPPPPPPPAAGARVAPTRAPAAPRPAEAPSFVAPIEVPAEIVPEEAIDLGVEGGMPGGVEGGVPGGVVGGIVGGMPAEAAPPVKAVRVGGRIVAPKLLKKVNPEYPEVARSARVPAMIILEATADERGQVMDVRVLRGHPLFDEAAAAAVRQWRYKPLLLNGIPTPFVITVTLVFKLTGPEGGAIQ